MSTNQVRDKGYRVRLSQSMAQRFSDYATRYGMPDSTLMSFIISEWVNSKDNQHKVNQMAALDISKRMAEKFTSDEFMASVEAVVKTQFQNMTVE